MIPVWVKTTLLLPSQIVLCHVCKSRRSSCAQGWKWENKYKQQRGLNVYKMESLSSLFCRTCASAAAEVFPCGDFRCSSWVWEGMLEAGRAAGSEGAITPDTLLWVWPSAAGPSLYEHSDRFSPLSWIISASNCWKCVCLDLPAFPAAGWWEGTWWWGCTHSVCNPQCSKLCLW